MTRTIEVPVDENVASALALVRDYALTFDDHPEKTTGNGAQHIAASETRTAKFAIERAAELLEKTGLMPERKQNHARRPRRHGGRTDLDKEPRMYRMSKRGAHTYDVPVGTTVEIIGTSTAPVLDGAWHDRRRGSRQTGLVTIGEEIEPADGEIDAGPERGTGTT